ncbi:BREX system Lon protease-like protein BrxL [Candidatus Poribacteria bacterium]
MSETESAGTFQSKAKDVFGEVCIDKGLFLKSGMLSRSIPTFVAEWILDKFCPTGQFGDESLDKINDFISQHLPRKEDKEAIKNRLMNGEALTILDQFSVSVDLKSNTLRLKIPSIDEDGFIERFLVDRYQNLLGGGIWGAGKLTYHPPDLDSQRSMGEVWLNDFKPMQVAQLDIDYYCEQRCHFTLNEWRELLVNSMGYNPRAYSPQKQLWLLTRLLPIVEPRVNLIELAPKGTGKSFVYQNLSKYTRVVSGGKISAPVLFYNLQSNTPGLLTQYDLVVFDEAQTISFDNPGEVIGVLKDYLESGRYTRGRQQATADAGLVLLANVPIASSGRPREQILFHSLPAFLQETAFIDRLHGILPGWDLPRITTNSPAHGTGFKADFFAEVLHSLRERGGYSEYVQAHLKIVGTDDMRDKRAIDRLATGYLKLLFPDLNLDTDEFYKYCALPSVTLRQAIRDQLCRMDSEYKQESIAAEVV